MICVDNSRVRLQVMCVCGCVPLASIFCQVSGSQWIGFVHTFGLHSLECVPGACQEPADHLFWISEMTTNMNNTVGRFWGLGIMLSGTLGHVPVVMPEASSKSIQLGQAHWTCIILELRVLLSAQ